MAVALEMLKLPPPVEEWLGHGVRAALGTNTDEVGYTRKHNDANVLALPARFISYELAEKMAEIFLTTPFEGGRHQSRVTKIACS